MFNLESSLVYACCVFCSVIFRINAANVVYQARRHEYCEVAQIQRYETRSAIECSTLCDIDEACLATNYNMETSDCEFLPQLPLSSDVTVTSQNWMLYTGSEPCDEEWAYFNLSCYLLEQQDMYGQDADARCTAHGAELVDFHSAAENTFVRNYATSRGITSYVWIGLNDVAEEGTFKWSSGRPLTYTDFATTQPDNWDDEDCVLINVGLLSNNWADAPCTSIHMCASICEKSTN